ncbi:MAG: phage holin family protein [Clostridia bacterium]|nr:phage holin family protein [Clostridia bacterium]
MNWDKCVKALAALAGWAAGLLGEWNALTTSLAAAMAVDYLTGLIAAWRGRSPKSEGGGVSSRAGFDGLLRKAFILAVILLATLLDWALGSPSRAFQTAATMYYLANEGISILENAALMGVPVPKALKSALETMKKEEAQKEE